MLAVERQFAHSGHDAPSSDPSGLQQHRPADVSSVEFDVELGELEREEGIPGASGSRPSIRNPVKEIQETQRRALPLTLGLVVHALADGLALGSAALSESAEDATAGASGWLVPSGLSIVVFLALAVHKGVLRYIAFCARCIWWRLTVIVIRSSYRAGTDNVSRCDGPTGSRLQAASGYVQRVDSRRDAAVVCCAVVLRSRRPQSLAWHHAAILGTRVQCTPQHRRHC